MSKFIEDKTRFILVRKINEDIEQVASLDDYNGNIYWTESIENAYKFGAIEDAKKLMSLQVDLCKLINKECKFDILEEHQIINEINK